MGETKTLIRGYADLSGYQQSEPTDCRRDT